MRKMTRWAPILALALLVVSTQSFAQGTYNKAAFESIMDDAVKQMRVLLGTLIGEDWGKAADGSAALAAQAKKMHALTPKVGADRIAEFQAHADSLEAQVTRLAAAAKARDVAKTATLYGAAVSTCMDCHKTFRR